MEDEMTLRRWALEHYGTVCDASPDAIFLVDRDGCVQMANGMAHRILGYEDGALLGKSVDELLPTDLRSQHPAQRASYFAAPRVRTMGAGRDLKTQRANGTHFVADISLAPVTSPFGPLVYVSMRDVSERVEARRHLERARAALEARVESRTQQLWSTNRLLTLDIKARLEAEGALNRQVRRSEALAQLGDFALTAPLARVFEEAVDKVRGLLELDVVAVYEHRLEDLAFHLRAAAGFRGTPAPRIDAEPRSGSPQAYTFLVQGPVLIEDRGVEDRFLWPIDLQAEDVQGAVSVPVPGDRSPYGVLLAAARVPRPFSLEDTAFLHEVSRILAAAVSQERYRHRVLEQETLARIGAMATVVAHEVRNPLGGISGAVQVLKGSVAKGSEDAQILDMILARIATLDDTISDLLAFARPRAPLLAPNDPNEIVKRALTLFEKDPAQARIEVAVEGRCRSVRCDRDQIAAVLQNLLLNASHAMGGRGAITISVAEVADHCRIAVRDQGSGVPESLREKIFEPFFTTKRQGTGLGLATSRRMVEAHGGTLAAAGTPDRGALMVMTLPLGGPEAERARATASA